MLSKDELRREFSKDPKRFYSTETFAKEGFERRKCSACGKFFWTVDPERTLCGEPEHEPYSFFKDKPVEIDYEDFWNKFADFFRKRGHAVVDKYPVVSRWRPDLYFTIASIQDFQRIENGAMSFEYPANPLIVPQICLRFNDIPNTGVTGRHFTAFTMAGQHSFNYPKEGYWRDETMALDYELLTKVLGVKKKSLTFTENVWAMGDFSEYGACLESFSGGLEMVNSVFTEFEYVNGKVRELKDKVIDVGLGLERLMWFYAGTQTAYDAVFRRELRHIHGEMGIKPDARLYSKVAGVLGAVDATEAKDPAEAERKVIEAAGVSADDYYNRIKPMQAAYAIADHARALLFAISDGALPSNTGGGYNLRILLRRIFSFLEAHGSSMDVVKLMELEASHLKNVYGGIDAHFGVISEVVKVEKERYDKMRAAASKIVTTMIERKEDFSEAKLKTLYESNGITPELIEGIAKSKGMKLEVRENFYQGILKGDFAEKKAKEEKLPDVDLDKFPKTEQHSYSFAERMEAKVLLAKDGYVILDRTPFYSEGGGQEADNGTIDGKRVTQVLTAKGVTVHMLEGRANFKEGSKVECLVDTDRRLRLMAHHTATHLVSAAARKVLGNHAWQEGAKKSPAKAHIDIAHYEKLLEKQVAEIEDTANGFILNGIKVTAQEFPRNEAEKQFGFAIYQGHGVPSSRLRIIQIRDLQGNLIDAEACGGLHLTGRETSIGLIKIISASRPHDGIDRLEYVAGPAAKDYINAMERDISHIASLVEVDRDKLKEGLEMQLKELSGYKAQYKQMGEKLASYIGAELLAEKSSTITREMDYERRFLREVATKVAESNRKAVVLLYNKRFEFVCIAGADSGANASEFLKANAAKIRKGQFTGGGSARIAEGRVS